MAKLGQLLCDTRSFNQGVGRCTVDLGILKYLIAIPKGLILSQSDLEVLETTLSNMAKADNPMNRAYLMGPIRGYENTNTEAATEDLTDGSTIYTSLGNVGFTLRFLNGGLCAWKNLLKFHQSQDQFDFLHYHDNGLLVGVRAKDSDGEWGMKGIDYNQFFVPNPVGATSTTANVYNANIVVGDSRQMREDMTFVDLKQEGIRIEDVMKPVVDVELNAVVVTPTSVVDIEAVTACGGENMTSLYGVELAVTGMWTVTNGQTGQEVTVSSVSVQGGDFRFTLDDNDPDFPGSGGTLVFNLAPISVLTAGGVIGFEGVPAVVTVPSS